MKGKEQRKQAVQELMISGYTSERIAAKLNVGIATVYRDVKKIREGSAHWLENIVSKDLAHIYHEALEGYRQDLMRLNDILSEPNVQKNKTLQIQIIQQISATRSAYLKQLQNAPYIWSLELCYKKYRPEKSPQPPLKSLDGITGVIA